MSEFACRIIWKTCGNITERKAVPSAMPKYSASGLHVHKTLTHANLGHGHDLPADLNRANRKGKLGAMA